MIYLFFLLAQTPSYTLDGITVTASVMDGLPFDVEVITSEILQGWGVENLKEALEHTTGINFSDYGYDGALKTAKVGGGTASQTLILIDGVPANDPANGSFDLSSVPISMIKSIEIIKGAGSIFKGSSAINGIINIISKDKGLGGNISYGRWNTKNAGLNLGYKLGKIRFGILPVYKASDGFRENSALDMKGMGAYFSGYGLDMKAQYMEKKIGVPGPAMDDSIYDASAPNDWQYDRINNATLSYKKVFEKTMIGAKLFYKKNYIQCYSEYYDFTANAMVYDTSEYNTMRFGGEIVDAYYPFTIYLGISADSADGIVYGSPFSGFRTDIYASLEFTPELENVYPFFAVRWDRNSQFGFFPTYSVGMKYKLAERLKAYFSFSKAFRAPTMDELYYPWYGNESLSVETSDSYTLGINGYGISASLTHREVNNMIISYQTSAWGYSAKNIETYTANVINLSYRMMINYLLIDGGIEYLSGKEKIPEIVSVDSLGNITYETKAKKIMYSPPLSTHLTIGWKHKRFSASLNYTYKDERYRDYGYVYPMGDSFFISKGTIDLPSYSLLNFHIAVKPAEHLTISGDIDNILDKKYSAYFGNGFDANYPGKPRSFRISLIYNL